LIAEAFAPIADRGGLGLQDDAACFIPPPGMDLVLSTDAIVEGVHCFSEDPPGSIARKALGVNLSDLAAKGAVPAGFLLTLGRSAGLDRAWVLAFAAALGEAAAQTGCPLFGGDSVNAAPIGIDGRFFISIAAFGCVPRGQMVKRQGGIAGDALYVSGTIGDAALGLAMRLAPDAPWVRALSASDAASLLDRYLHPAPRLALAPALRRHARGAMDVSDGLLADCRKLAMTLGREIALSSVPISRAASAAIALAPELFETALTGGDDYEILAAIPPDSCAAFETEAARCRIAVARIGQLLPREAGTSWRDGEGNLREFPREGFEHSEPLARNPGR
jgi:thiamine-monophosphate kinase